MDYNGAIELIKKAEAEDTMPRSVKIDLSDLNDKMPIKEYNSKEVASAMNFVDKAEGKSTPSENRAAIAGQAVQKQTEQMQTQTTQTMRRTGIMKDFEAAASELQGAVSQIEVGIEKVSEKKSTSKLILPTLSLNDQLSELEKINLGLDENIFNKDQIRVITQEVQGLSKTKGKNKPAAGVDPDLEALRDRRLKEVLSKLGVK